MHVAARQPFQAAAESICEALSRGLNGPALHRSSSTGGAPSVYEAQQAAFRIELAIRKLSQLRVPNSASAPAGELVLALRRLQVLGLESVRSPHGGANALSSAIARAEQQVSSAATAAGLPACAQLHGAIPSKQAPTIPGQPTAPGQGVVPGQPGPGQRTVPGQSVPRER